MFPPKASKATSIAVGVQGGSASSQPISRQGGLSSDVPSNVLAEAHVKVVASAFPADVISAACHPFMPGVPLAFKVPRESEGKAPGHSIQFGTGI